VGGQGGKGQPTDQRSDAEADDRADEQPCHQQRVSSDVIVADAAAGTLDTLTAKSAALRPELTMPKSWSMGLADVPVRHNCMDGRDEDGDVSINGTRRLRHAGVLAIPHYRLCDCPIPQTMHAALLAKPFAQPFFSHAVREPTSGEFSITVRGVAVWSGFGRCFRTAHCRLGVDVPWVHLRRAVPGNDELAVVSKSVRPERRPLDRGPGLVSDVGDDTRGEHQPGFHDSGASGLIVTRLRGLIHAPVDFGAGFVEIDDSTGRFLATVGLPAVTPDQVVVPFDVDISPAQVSESDLGLSFTVREVGLPAPERCGLGE
jgi:hypothetical protein